MKLIELFTRGNTRRDTIREPKGIKISEWVNCLWNSRNKIGSVDDPIKTSKSGANPARKPIRPTLKILLLLEVDCAKTAPTVPCDNGSIIRLFPLLNIV